MEGLDPGWMDGQMAGLHGRSVGSRPFIWLMTDFVTIATLDFMLPSPSVRCQQEVSTEAR